MSDITTIDCATWDQFDRHIRKYLKPNAPANLTMVDRDFYVHYDVNPMYVLSPKNDRWATWNCSIYLHIDTDRGAADVFRSSMNVNDLVLMSHTVGVEFTDDSGFVVYRIQYFETKMTNDN